MGSDGVKAFQAKFFYVVFLGLGTLIGFAFGRIGERSAAEDGGFVEELLCQGDVCNGEPAVLRASLASVIFFSIMFLGTVPVPTCRGDESWKPLLGEGFHRGFWGLKIFVYFGLLVGFFFVSINEDAFINIARVVSGFFLIAQILVLIDFAYIWDEAWVERSDVENDFADGSKCWIISLIGIAVLCYIGAFGGMIALLALYSGCSKTIGVTAYNLAICIVFVGLTLARGYLIEDEVAGSVAPPAVVAVYIAFLSFSASQSNPDAVLDPDNCDPFDDALGQNGFEIFLSIVISTLSLVWMALTVSGNSTSLLTGNGDERHVADVGGAYEIEEEDGTTRYAAEAKDGDDDDEAFENDKLWFFHLIMITASFYMAMILTNWGISEDEVADGGDVGNASFFVKATASWLAGLIFIWTIIAPAVLPDRDW